MSSQNESVVVELMHDVKKLANDLTVPEPERKAIVADSLRELANNFMQKSLNNANQEQTVKEKILQRILNNIDNMPLPMMLEVIDRLNAGQADTMTRLTGGGGSGKPGTTNNFFNMGEGGTKAIQIGNPSDFVKINHVQEALGIISRETSKLVIDNAE